MNELTPSIKKIDEAIDKAINYLSQHQLPSGEFVCYMAPDETMQEWCVPESITGITAVIGSCLLPFQDRPLVDKMLTKASNYLLYQDIRRGIWQYYAKWHRLFGLLPPDIDDTVLISGFLKKRNINFPDNLPILLLNRNNEGLFYTWFTIHSNFFKYSKIFWRLIARELKHPIKTLLFWINADHKRKDIDVVVNANVTCYLGYNDITRPAVRYIRDTLVNNKEKESDKWYLNKIVYYSFLSRLYELEIPELTEIKELFKTKVINAINSSKIFNDCDLELALSISSLLRIGCNCNEVADYVSRLLSLQASTGEWRRHELVTGPKKALVWGSEETTTAYCIEALHLYKKSTLQHSKK